ncbi:hypothetical protein [Streptomyces sp. NBC_00358]|uniref:hypothetical protein n=1 Tax=Streptomyces sp. NBC_00358 TaxID=2975725 RepID=UPI002E25CA9B
MRTRVVVDAEVLIHGGGARCSNPAAYERRTRLSTAAVRAATTRGRVHADATAWSDVRAATRL